MFLLIAAIQTPLRPGTPTGNLSILNELGISVVVIGALLIILMLMHYYRMQDNRKKSGRALKGKAAKWDPVSQYEFMCREDLKSMILKEKAEGEKAEQDNEIESMENSTQAIEEYEPDLDNTTFLESLESLESPADLTGSHSTNEAELLASLVISEDDKAEKDPEKVREEPPKAQKSPEPPAYKPGYKVERSSLSTELPENFPRKSRRI